MSSSSGVLETTAILIPLRPSDNLRSLSLAFNVPLEELKRANRLGSEEEFYGLSSLKVPAHRHSALAERLFASYPEAVFLPDYDENGWRKESSVLLGGGGSPLGGGSLGNTSSTQGSEPEEGAPLIPLDRNTKRLKKMLKNVDSMLELEKNKWSRLGGGGSDYPESSALLGGGSTENRSYGSSSDGRSFSGLCVSLIILALLIVLLIAKLTFHEHNGSEQEEGGSPIQQALEEDSIQEALR